MEKILISACLAGFPTRYDGGTRLSVPPVIAAWIEQGRMAAVCPEIAGGLPTPRPPAEIIGAGGGQAVLDGKASVINCQGQDVTAAYLQGAARILTLVMDLGLKWAVLKDGSPSCGSARIYDGTFQGITIQGCGVATALLQKHGVLVFSEHQIEQALALIR